MTSAKQFQKQIEKATTGLGSTFKGPGRTAIIAAALRAYEDSVSRGDAQAEQAAYLYQVIRNCNTWIRLKGNESGASTAARRRIIVALLQEANLELRKYPLVARALDRYARNKSAGQKGGTPLKEVYVHEGARYRELKAQGQFVDPGRPRFAPSATLIEKTSTDPRVQGTAFSNGKYFTSLTFQEFTELDRLLGSQYRVLYLSKLQRLAYMVDVDDGEFCSAVTMHAVAMDGSTVESDLGITKKNSGLAAGPDRETYAYACDRFGNLFVAKNDLKDASGNDVQLNHSSFLAGREVLCAGTISIKNGVLKGISNNSGHYKPDANALTTMLGEWRDRRVNLDRVLVYDRSQGGGIVTLGSYYMRADYRDRESDARVLWARSATR